MGLNNNNQSQALWQCQKCATQVYANKNMQPRTNGCPSGGSHEWNKLTR
jgi:ABC-type ATPase with predicted acetyltransferase domain